MNPNTVRVYVKGAPETVIPLCNATVETIDVVDPATGQLAIDPTTGTVRKEIKRSDFSYENQQ